jgi:hypothetical protein
MRRMMFSRTIGALTALALAAWVVSTAQAAGPAAATAAATLAQPAIAAPPISIGGRTFGTPLGMPMHAANVAGGLGGGGTLGVRFGSALYGTPLGNLQLQTGGNPTYGPSGINNGGNGAYGASYNGSLNGPTIAGVNGAGNVLGGATSGRFQGFQNGAFEIGGFSRGVGVGGNYPMPTLFGTALPNYSAAVPGMNNAIYGTNAPQVYGPANGYNPGNYGTNTYGFTPTPQVGMENAPSALPPNPQMAPPAPVQYGYY